LIVIKCNLGAPKLFSLGYSYVRDGKPYVDKTGKSRQYWKCDNKECTGRGVSYDLTPPLILTQAHEYWHETNSSRVEVNKNMAKLKEKATNSRDKPGAIIKDVVKTNTADTLMANPSHAAMRQTVSRVRKTNDICVKEAVNLKDHFVILY
jgi:uncharacterized protein YfcZ (UPF0381/DUF406 family)